MAGRFLLRRSEAARDQAQRNVDASVAKIAALVALVTSLADRMEAMPSAGLDRDRERRARVQVLRRTAAAGVRTLVARAGERPGVQDARRSGR